MREFHIDEKNVNRKLFRFIRTILPEAGNSDIFKMLRKKVIVVNGKKCDSNYLLQSGDSVQLYLKEENFKESGQVKFKNVHIQLDIVYEDEKLLVINKPAGLLIHPDQKNYHNTLTEGVKAYLYRKGEYQPDHPYTPAACNRLDLNTSGLVLVARTHDSLKKITAAFRERNTSKKYLAICCGRLDSPILITSIIDSRENSENKVQVKDLKVLKKIPEKITFIETRRELSATLIRPVSTGRDFTLLEVDLWTGKKHQIRAHLRAAGYPLAGDKKYFTELSAQMSRQKGLTSYYLHAWRLSIPSYEEWTAPLPPAFSKAAHELTGTEI